MAANNYIDLPLEGANGSGITSLNGDTSAAQTLVTATTGTDFTISTSGGVSTFAIPTASASARGLLSSANWTTFNNKQAAVSFAAVGSTPSANGGGISAGVITLQPADGTHPGLLTSIAQTIGGAKTFAAQILSSSGTLAAPGISFSSEAGTGWLLAGALNPQFSLGNSLTIDMFKNGAVHNFGFGTAADTGVNNPWQVLPGSFTGTQFFQYGNTSTGSTSATSFQILNGVPNISVSLSLENHAYTQAGYLAGVCVVTAGAGCGANFNIMNEWASNAQIVFNLGGRAAVNESFIINSLYFTPALKTSDPTAPEGSIYYNTSTHKLRLFDGSSWVSLN